MAKEKGKILDINDDTGMLTIERPEGKPNIEVAIAVARNIRLAEGDEIQYDVDDRGGRVVPRNIRNLNSQQVNVVTVRDWIFGIPTVDDQGINLPVTVDLQQGSKPAVNAVCSLFYKGQRVEEPAPMVSPSNGKVFFEPRLDKITTVANFMLEVKVGDKVTNFTSQWRSLTGKTPEHLEVKFIQYLDAGIGQIEVVKIASADNTPTTGKIQIISNVEVGIATFGLQKDPNNQHELEVKTRERFAVILPVGIMKANVSISLANGKSNAFPFMIKRPKPKE